MNIEKSLKVFNNYIKGKDTMKESLVEAIETLLTAYEKEKEANRKLDKEAQGYLEELAGDDSMNIRRIQELEAELEKEKEKNKEYENMIINHKKQLKQSGIYGYDYDLKILKEE